MYSSCTGLYPSYSYFLNFSFLTCWIGIFSRNPWGIVSIQQLSIQNIFIPPNLHFILILNQKAERWSHTVYNKFYLRKQGCSPRLEAETNWLKQQETQGGKNNLPTVFFFLSATKLLPGMFNLVGGFCGPAKTNMELAMSLLHLPDMTRAVRTALETEKAQKNLANQPLNPLVHFISPTLCDVNLSEWQAWALSMQRRGSHWQWQGRVN